MRHRLGFTALLLLAGCGSTPAVPVDNTADICARWLTAAQPYLARGDGAAPEAKAYQEAMSDAFAGKELPQAEMKAIQQAYWTAQEKAPRELAGQATNPNLRNALSNYADELHGRSTDVIPEFIGSESPVRQALTKVCPG